MTGGAGFMGAHLTRALIAEGWAVDVADDLSSGDAGNLPAEADLVEVDLGTPGAMALLPTRRWDAICHVAGQSSGEKSFDDPLRDSDANARSTVALAALAQERGVPVLVHASSMGVYGDVDELPVSETVEPRPISWYGASKLAAERSLAVARDVRGVSLRMFSIYGPGQDLAELRQGMVSIFLAMALAGDPVAVRGPLDRVRDFVYVDDCVDAWLRAVATPQAQGPVNVGTGVGTSIRDLLTLMSERLGLESHPIEEIEVRTPGDQYALFADTARAKLTLGWEARTNLREGLDRMVRWARDD